MYFSYHTVDSLQLKVQRVHRAHSYQLLAYQLERGVEPGAGKEAKTWRTVFYPSYEQDP